MNGHVYIAMPPLYKAIPSRGQKSIFTMTRHWSATAERHTGDLSICSATKVWARWMPEQLWETTLDPENREC